MAFAHARLAKTPLWRQFAGPAERRPLSLVGDSFLLVGVKALVRQLEGVVDQVLRDSKPLCILGGLRILQIPLKGSVKGSI